MKHIKIIFAIGLIVVGMFNEQLCAKVRGVSSQREFEQNVAHKGVCVALFYNPGDRRDNSSLREKNKHLQRMFEDVSDVRAYDDADFAFIKINCARKEFDTLMNQYSITQLPRFMLFQDGRLVVDEEGAACVLDGFVTRGSLEALIHRCCGGEIKKMNMAKAATQKRRLEAEKSSWQPYFYPRDIFVRDYDPSQRSME